MSEPIIMSVEDIWNSRVEARMKDLKLSQRSFIKKYKDKFGTGSQSDVSKWVHVGAKDGKSKNPRKFPEFETMRRIAEVLEVSVGYLIGETDYESFDAEKVCKYTGLSSSAVKGLRNITSGKAVEPFFKYPDAQINSALNNLLNSPSLVEYLKKVSELAEYISRERNPKDYFDAASNKIPEALRDDVVALWADAEDAIENKGVAGTEEQWKYVKILDDAAMADMAQPDISERDVNACKYVLNEIHMKLVEEIMTPENIESMLPHYATEEEIKKLLHE